MLRAGPGAPEGGFACAFCLLRSLGRFFLFLSQHIDAFFDAAQKLLFPEQRADFYRSARGELLTGNSDPYRPEDKAVFPLC